MTTTHTKANVSNNRELAAAKGLKLWNGRGFSTKEASTIRHVYVCAKSATEARRMCNEFAGFDAVSMHEIRVYWSPGAWGTKMDGIEPEPGVWVTYKQPNGESKPVRAYPRREDVTMKLRAIMSWLDMQRTELSFGLRSPADAIKLYEYWTANDKLPDFVDEPIDDETDLAAHRIKAIGYDPLA